MKNNVDKNNLNPDFRLNKKKEDNTKNIFFKTFSLTLILMAIGLYFFTPNIDVQIGDISSDSDFDEEIEYANKKNIDYRLRWIQLEDNGNQLIDRLKNNEENSVKENNEPDDNIDNELDYKPDSAHNDNSLPMEPNQLPQKNQAQDNTSDEIHLDTSHTQQTQAKSTFSKVYIGSYNDINSAIEAQNKLLEADLPVSPFIKKLNNVYVIQVGSFASLNKAQILVNQLAQHGFQARIVEE
ncbi:MAG: hypothetical protein BHW64_00210 [Candidatus Melainabacteria bacterium LEY3_CP_29_8]|nr:MAG: hypothetical protein BHW64_00210 [Candidatus Melainabacteria bacterium LEY3_CP_29_8]